MRRPVYTALYMLMIVGIFFSLSLIYQSCGEKKQAAPTAEELAEKAGDVSDSYTQEEFFEDDDDTGSDSDDTEEDTEEMSTIDDDNDDSYTTTASSSSYSNSTPAATSSSLGQGGYIVVAGNYLLENNASEMVRKLKAAGYNKADKVVFDLSQYYTVVAGSYDSRSLANSVSSELTGKGIDNYVLKRKG